MAKFPIDFDDRNPEYKFVKSYVTTSLTANTRNTIDISSQLASVKPSGYTLVLAVPCGITRSDILNSGSFATVGESSINMTTFIVYSDFDIATANIFFIAVFKRDDLP